MIGREDWALRVETYRKREHRNTIPLLAEEGWRDSDTRAGIADEIPPNEILVAPIEWIGERSLDRVRPQQIEELRGAARETVGLILFDCLEDGVLLGCRKFRERHAFRRLGVVVDCRQAGAVDGP